MNTKSIEEIRAVVSPIAEEMGVEIVDIEFKMSKNPTLTVFADTNEGIDLDTCAKLHRAIDLPLDELDPTFGEPYTLNVSSPGLDRPFKTERDFARNMGKKVEVKLYAPIKGKKFFEGLLKDYDGNTVTLLCGTEEIKLNLSQVAKINLAIEVL